MNRIRTLVGLVVALATTAGAQGKVPGWTLTMRMTIDSGNGSPTVISMKLTGSGTKAYQKMSARGTEIGSIINGEDSTVTAVMEQMGMAVITKPSLVGIPMPKFSFADLKTQKTELGTETVSGIAARHTRVVLSATMTQSLNGLTCARPYASDLEAWTAGDTVLPRVMKAMQAALSSLTPAGGSGGSNEVSRLAEAAGVGAPLKMVSREKLAGIDRSLTMTTEYSDYALVEVDASLFNVPPGMNVQDMRQMNLAAMMGSGLGDRISQQLWSKFDTTAAAGANRATCKKD